MKFELSKAIPAAWDFIWKAKLADRAAGRDFRGDTYYTTAQEMEQQVRSFAYETSTGKAWGTNGIRGYSYGIRFRGDLQAAVRSYLLRTPGIVGHNFGRGHISGMRFRPAGAPVSPGEAETIERKAKPRAEKPRHIGTYSQLACMPRRDRFRRGRSMARLAFEGESITCPKCLKLLGDRDPRGPFAGKSVQRFVQAILWEVL